MQEVDTTRINNLSSGTQQQPGKLRSKEAQSSSDSRLAKVNTGSPLPEGKIQ